MQAAGGTLCRWMASITFGGADLKTVHLGLLQGARSPMFRAPVAGLPLPGWSVMRVTITGAGGFLGACISHVLAADPRVTALRLVDHGDLPEIWWADRPTG